MVVSAPSEEAVFEAALEKTDPEVRAAYLAGVCGSNIQLRRRVENLLAAHDSAKGVLDAPPSVFAATASYSAVTERPGSEIGPYKLREQIGEGGFGVVYVAEQEKPVARKVALKIIKPGMDTKEVIARFEAERQALALMDHPNIARIFDAGTTESGRPFFVMEFVKGIPITDYCDQQQLSTGDRLNLFVSVCRAVQHAHGKGVIHRDLKPSNILISPYDGVPVVKVIDFGVAKAIGPKLTDKTIYTAAFQMIGTPLYMSPEQAEINALDVDTRSDVYSLGVLLYELLTGTTPLDRQRLKTAAFDEIRRIIREEEPPRPSTRLTTLGAELAQVSTKRKLDAAKLMKMIRGELDWIVMRCLEKDRNRRYDTVAGLAKDVQRFLADEPVEARPATLRYRALKAFRRNRAALTTAAAFVALIVAGLALVTWKWRDERLARQDADVARKDAENRAEELVDAARRMNSAQAAIELAKQQAAIGQFAAAERSLNQAIRLRGDHYQVWLERGQLYASMALWDQAFRDYQQAFRRHTPENVAPWFQYAILHVLARELTGYRDVCDQMRKRFGNPRDEFTRGHVHGACSLHPTGAPKDFDWRSSSPNVERLPPRVKWLGHFGRGLAHYRAHRYTDAIPELRHSLTLTNYAARNWNHSVLAMAFQRSGDPQAARKELETARMRLDRWMQAAEESQEKFVPWKYWHDWAQFLILYREAHRLINGSEPPQDNRLQAIRDRALSLLKHR